MEESKILSQQDQSSEFAVELHSLTMPGIVVSAWVRSPDQEEASVLLGFKLSELEC
jgi:hypothetical protein